ncbi:MAG: iron-containing alcohol dehydrogenase, partial [Deltaproteobacteria bacterium]|nr:iron-containing alcohol dehydrogenase [Deltaproteobacteria bacterium]
MSESPPVGDFHFPTAYRIGAGRVRELPGACRELGIRRPLVVTDPGIAGLDWMAPILESLVATGLEVHVFSEIDPNPSASHVEGGLDRLR